MSFLQSIKSAGFKLDGLKEFPGTTFKINISFTDSNISEQDIIKCEWFLDGLLIENENGFEVSGEGYCGEHIIAARILTGEVCLTIYNIDKPIIDLSEFDFIVICHLWQHAATDGLDVLVGFENSISVNNNQYVVYSNPTDKIPTEANGLDQGYLFWSNDSVQSTGKESVLINFKKFSSDFSTNAKVGDFSFMDFVEPDFSVDDKNNIGQIGLYSIWRGNSLGTGFFSRSLRGDSAFYSLDIIAKNIRLQLPFGMRLVLNPDEDGDSNISSFPISFQWQINGKKI